MSEKIESIYKKVTQIEHVLLRPDTYIGSIENNSLEFWILEDPSQLQFKYKEIDVCQGLYKIFDEILVNAADNYQRDKNMSSIQVTINQKSCEISIENDGKGIPIQIHKEHNCYIPELIFGHLLTSSNYDDSIKKVTGGRNGYGAKLTNIFSKRFTLKTQDKHKNFKMTWFDNMSRHTEPEITEAKGSQYTKVTFVPDLDKFKQKQLSNDMVSLMQKRVVDMAGLLGDRVTITLNGEKIPIKSFKDYTQLFNQRGNLVYDSKKVHKHWEVIVGASEGQFTQVSFVNAISTIRGGTHVTYIADQIVEALLSHVKKKFKEIKNIKPFQVKQHLSIYVNCLIENPAFDSQTKETLTTKSSQFGSVYQVPESFINEIIKKTEIINNVVLTAKSKIHNKLAKQLTGKKQQRLLGIDKLEDANDAGTKHGEQCTLILTEGDSAKSLAMAGIEVVGRDKYGVFPLRGKILNVRDATIKQMMENKEIEQLVKIMGLQFNKKYDNLKTLRYGSIVIMTDQDHDGHHIKGLIINLFEKLWPSLFETRGFLKQFITPIVKISKGRECIPFYSISDYRKWKNSTPDYTTYKIKYYKGLGTSTDIEAQDYFNNLKNNVKPFKFVDQSDHEYFDLAFNKQKTEQRKEWLSQYSWENIEDTLDYGQSNIRYKTFITDCLSLHSISNNLRCIPCLLDGLKPTQRKIIYTLLLHNSELKVSSLSGLVTTFTQYHHGEESLQQTIISMAQTFTGSNNLNLLLPNGQFGTRAQGGKDAAQARYISTKLNPLAQSIFHEDDLHTLTYLEEDGIMVEPINFVPILPLVLLNGCEGIGTGWMTSVPQYNPRELCEILKRKLKGEEYNEEPIPWYKGFSGEINYTINQFQVRGKFIRHKDLIFITEIPFKKTTKDYQSFLLSKMAEKDSEQAEIQDIREYHAGNQICFQLKVREDIAKMSDEQLEKYFKLTLPINLNNLVLFSSQGTLKRCSSANEIINEFFNQRLPFYLKRRQYLISKCKNELELVQSKFKFLNCFLEGSIEFKGLKKNEMIEKLKKMGFKEMRQLHKIESTKPKSKIVKKLTANEEDDSQNIDKQYDYLLGLPIWSFSSEKLEELKKQEKNLKNQLTQLESFTPEQMWENDLNNFLRILDESERKEEDETLKRLEKNMEKFYKGGAKLLKDIVSSKNQSRRQVEEDDDFNSNDDDDDDSENEKNPQIKIKVIKEFSNLGISSKREYQSVQPIKNQRKQDQKDIVESEQQNELQIEIEDNQEKEKEKKPRKKKNQQKTEDEQDEVIELEKSEKQKKGKAKKNNDDSDEIFEVQKKEKQPRKQKLIKNDESSDEVVEVEVIERPKRNKNHKTIIDESDQSADEEFLINDEESKKKKKSKKNDNESENENKYSQKEKKKKNNQKKIDDSEDDLREVKPKNQKISKQPKRKQIQIVDESESSEDEFSVQGTPQKSSKPARKQQKAKEVTSGQLELEMENKEQPKKQKKLEVKQQEERKPKTEEEKLYEKYGLGQFLKYLTPLEQNDTKAKVTTDMTQMTLSERLMMREQQGKIDIYKQSYDEEVKKNQQESEKLIQQKDADKENVENIFNYINLDSDDKQSSQKEKKKETDEKKKKKTKKKLSDDEKSAGQEPPSKKVKLNDKSEQKFARKRNTKILDSD